MRAVQDYEPFGSLLPGRNYSSDSYRFGFNGMESDKEMHDAPGTSYDFGARLYSSRESRFLSLDPLAQKAPDESPYAISGNSPIHLIDKNGEYKYPADREAAYRKQYPMLTLYLEKMVRTDKLKSQPLVKAMTTHTAGYLTQRRLFEATTWGQGPEITFEKDPGWPETGAGGFFNRDFAGGRIELNESRMQALEQLLQNEDAPMEEKQAAMMGFFTLLTHETGHYGDRTGIRYTGKEVGFAVENEVWGGENYLVEDFKKIGERFDPATQKALVKEQQAKPEGERALPRVPVRAKKK